MTWSGEDDPDGSGLAGYDIYVSDNGGPFTAFLTGTTQTSATFTGQVGHTYAFYSVATDNVGHVEDFSATAEVSTQVIMTVTSIAGASPNPRNTPVSHNRPHPERADRSEHVHHSCSRSKTMAARI